MEDELLHLLTNTQSADQNVRVQGELTLKVVKTNPAYPLSLANIAAHTSVDTGIRQAALSVLRQFIEKNWSPDGADSEPPVAISDETRERLRQGLLELSLSQEDNRKVKIAASYAVGKIANFDVPDRWPNLLSTLLGIIPTGNDAQIHGALRIIGDIVEESLSEDQFFTLARDIIKALTTVSLNENRNPAQRALAISVFRGCFDLLDTVKDEYSKEVKAFGEELLKEWNPFFLQVLKAPFPAEPLTPTGQPESWKGLIMLKLQVLKTLIKIKATLPNLLVSHSTDYFGATWQELLLLQDAHKQLYVDNDAQSRMEDADNLPYTLDYLILEELDLIHQFIRAPPVQAQLEAQLKASPAAHETPWMRDVMKTMVTYSRITQEEEGLWDIDCSLYLAEEASVSANYTSRTASADLLIKLGEMFHQSVLDGLFSYTKTLFTGDAADEWRSQEASLYLFSMLVSDFQDMDKVIPEATARAYLELVDYAINQSHMPLLRARGYLVGSTLTRSIQTPDSLVERIFNSINGDDSEVVQVSCIRAVENLVTAKKVNADRQIPFIMAISRFIQSKDKEELEDADELIVTLTETLRSVMSVDQSVALANEVQPVELLFTLARLGAANFQVTMIVCEAFEDVVSTLSDPASFTALSSKVLPTLTSVLEAGNVTDDENIITVAVELLAVLIEHGTEPLPAGFVAAVLPKLRRLLMECRDGDILRPGAESVKYLLMHDHHQVFGWQDENGQTGLDICLHVIDRLLGTSIEDNSASEVGGLAAELVEKAGHERLGPYLLQLLRAVATRLGTAEAAPFIQSLILVFARLSLVGAHDVVEFLSQMQIGDHPGLQVVLSKWLENSVNFAGYDEIRQNVIALSKVYSLNDPRVAQTMVKGDLIVTNSNQIMTRSKTRSNPDQYTIVPASLKILKVLIEELLSASGAGAAAATAAAAAAAVAEIAEDELDDDGWEDDPDTLDLSLGTTKADLMNFIEGPGPRQRDDETQAYLTDFFIRAARDNVANFQEWYKLLTEDERHKLDELAATGGH